MDTLINFLMFALPGGFVGSIFTWLFGRRKRDNDMLSQLQASINLLSEENRKILEENVQLRRENADLKANQEEMILKLSCLTKEVERLRKVISKQSVNDERQNPGVDPRNPIIARRVPASRMRHVQREPGPSETGHGADGENDRQRRRVRGRGSNSGAQNAGAFGGPPEFDPDAGTCSGTGGGFDDSLPEPP